MVVVAVEAAPRPAEESRRDERETVTLMTRAPISALSMKYLQRGRMEDGYGGGTCRQVWCMG